MSAPDLSPALAERMARQARAVEKVMAIHGRIQGLARRFGQPIAIVDQSLASPATIAMLERAARDFDRRHHLNKGA